jgi:hypothetical protein
VSAAPGSYTSVLYADSDIRALSCSLGSSHFSAGSKESCTASRICFALGLGSLSQTEIARPAQSCMTVFARTRTGHRSTADLSYKRSSSRDCMYFTIISPTSLLCSTQHTITQLHLDTLLASMQIKLTLVSIAALLLVAHGAPVSNGEFSLLTIPISAST